MNASCTISDTWSISLRIFVKFFFSYSLNLSQRRSCWLVIQSCLFCDSMGCSPPGSSVHGISQARILEWAISFSRGSSSSRESFPTQVLNLHLLHWQAGSLHRATIGHHGEVITKWKLFLFLSEGKKNSSIRWQKSSISRLLSTTDPLTAELGCQSDTHITYSQFLRSLEQHECKTLSFIFNS